MTLQVFLWLLNVQESEENLKNYLKHNKGITKAWNAQLVIKRSQATDQLMEITDGSDSCLQVPWNEDPPKNPVQAIQTDISELPALE